MNISRRSATDSKLEYILKINLIENCMRKLVYYLLDDLVIFQRLKCILQFHYIMLNSLTKNFFFSCCSGLDTVSLHAVTTVLV